MGDKPALEGNLGAIRLSEVFQILGGNAGTGVLHLFTPYDPHPGMIYFVEGNPVNASWGVMKGLRAAQALFGWTEGRFEFMEQEVRTSPLITQSRMEIVLEALRMIDDGAIKKIGPVSLARECMGPDAAPDAGKRPRAIKGPLVDYTFIMAEEEYRKGERILKEGGHGKWMWVILGGTVGVSRETSAGSFEVARLGEGCFLGSTTALLFKEHVRSAGAHALSAVRLGLLDAERLSRIFTSLSPDLRRIFLQLDQRLQRIMDRAVELFTGRRPTGPDLKRCETVMARGFTGEDLFTIVEGEAVVVGQSRKGAIPLLRLGREDIFGFNPFLDMGHEPLSAAVLASKGLKTRPMDVEALHKEYNRLPPAFRNLVYHMGLLIFSATSRVVHLSDKG